jgi:pectate lyase
MWWYRGRKGTWRLDRSTGLVAQTQPAGAAVAYQVRNYRDVVFTLKARKTGGKGSLGVLVRTHENGHRYQWVLGGRDNTKDTLADEGGRVLGAEASGSLEPGRWYDLKVVASGDLIECTLDGKRVHSATDDTRRYGGVGLATWDATAEFKDLEVSGFTPMR